MDNSQEFKDALAKEGFGKDFIHAFLKVFERMLLPRNAGWSDKKIETEMNELGVKTSKEEISKVLKIVSDAQMDVIRNLKAQKEPVKEKQPKIKKGTISGICRKSCGDPLPGLIVKAFDTNYLAEDASLGESVTTENGLFEIKLSKPQKKQKGGWTADDSELDVVLTVYDENTKPLYTTKSLRYEDRSETLNIVIPTARLAGDDDRVTAFSPIEKLVDDPSMIRALKLLKFDSIAHIRTIDPELIAATPTFKRAEIDAAKLRGLKKQAILTAFTRDKKTMEALTAIKMTHPAKIAMSGMRGLRGELDIAVGNMDLEDVDIPSVVDLNDAVAEAQNFNAEMLKSKIASIAKRADTSCPSCDDDCCGDAANMSTLSKRAYINYLLRRFDSDVDEIAGMLRQDFALADCEKVSLIRLGIEVVEAALLGGDFEGVEPKALHSHMLTDRIVTRYALLRLAQTATLDSDHEANVRDFINILNDPFHDTALPPSTQDYISAIRIIDKYNHQLANKLNGFSNLGEDLLRSAWLEATTQDIEATENKIEIFNWGTSLAPILTLKSPDPALTHTFALNYRKYLIENLAKTSASELRSRYYVNFRDTDTIISRCDQAIATLQEALRCNKAFYVHCCGRKTDNGEVVEASSDTGTLFKDYQEYRLWIQQLLYPENFYDLHIKSRLVKGDVAALKAQLDEAETILEDITKQSTTDNTDVTMGSIMGLFRQGIETIRNLLEIDDLIARGHTAYRDEEYGLAVGFYQQAQQLIQRHVQNYHSATLANYEQLFYGVSSDCEDGKALITDAEQLCDLLREASLQPILTRQLVPVSSDKQFSVDNWMPRMNEFPEPDEFKDTLKSILEIFNDPDNITLSGDKVTLLNRLFVSGNNMQSLTDEQRDAGWTAYNYPEGVRHSLPFILRGLDFKHLDNLSGAKTAIENATAAWLGGLFGGEVQNFIDSAWEAFKAREAELLALHICLRNGLNSEDPSAVYICVTTYVTVSMDVVLSWFWDALSMIPGGGIEKAIEHIKKKVEGLMDPVSKPTIPEDFDPTNLDHWADLANDQKNRLSERLYNKFKEVQAVAGELTNLIHDNSEITGKYFRDLIGIIQSLVLFEDQALWATRTDDTGGITIQELSNLYHVDDVAEKNIFRRGTLLLDTDGINNEALDSYTGRFVIKTGDNDDLGIVFCVQDTGDEGKPRYSYYRLSMRNNIDESLDRQLARILFKVGYIASIAGLAVGNFSLLSYPPASWLTTVTTPMLQIAVIACPFVFALDSFIDKYVFPEDKAGSFVRLVKVDAQGSETIVTELDSALNTIIKKNTDYIIELILERVKETGTLRIYTSLAEKKSKPACELQFDDSEPLGKGGVGFYAFSNSPSIFQEASITYHTAGHDTLGKLLFLPKEDPKYDCQSYKCRMTSSPNTLQTKIQVDTNDHKYRFVWVNGKEHEPDSVDLSVFDFEDKPQLVYHPFDAFVDRSVLAQLTNDLVNLLPHYYFFILPLSIGDALHKAGDYERAKQHYDVIFDLFPNEVRQIKRDINGDNEETIRESYGDPPSRKGYSYLHRDIPVPHLIPPLKPSDNVMITHYQRGVEEALMRARHAANYLAAGEAGYFQDTPDSRQRAYEMFSRVLLSYGRTSCCSGWEDGRVVCLPGAPVVVDQESPEDAADSEDGTGWVIVYPDGLVGSLGERSAPSIWPSDMPDACVVKLSWLLENLEEITNNTIRREIVAMLEELRRLHGDDALRFCKELLKVENSLASFLKETTPEEHSHQDPGVFSGTGTTQKLDYIASHLDKDESANLKKSRDEIEKDTESDPQERRWKLSKLLHYWRSKAMTKNAAALSFDEISGDFYNLYELFGKGGLGVSVLPGPTPIYSLPCRGGGSAPVTSTSLALRQPKLALPFLKGANKEPNRRRSKTEKTLECVESDGCFDLEEKLEFDILISNFTCVPMNPLMELHLNKACMYLDNLDQGLNILGMREDQVTHYRFDYLMGLARNYARFSIAAEDDFINFREKLAQARISVMQQEHALQILGSQMRVQELNLAQADNQVSICDYQHKRTNTLDRHLDVQLGLNDIDMALAVLSGIAGVSQAAIGITEAGIGVVTTVAGIIAAPATLGASTVVSAAGAGLIFASSTSGGAGSVINAAQNIFNVYKQRVSLEQQQELLRNYDLPIARLNSANAELMRQMAERQIQINLMQIKHAELVLTYISKQFLNADMYSFLAQQSKQNYNQYLAYATRAALMAERALEMKRGQAYSIVKLNYFDTSVQGLMGGEALQKDIETLEYQSFIRNERRQYPPVKVYSLASSFPMEFEFFRNGNSCINNAEEREINMKKGQLYFKTDHLDFDLDYPGHYHRLIKSVRVNILALTGTEGIKATLTQLGASQIVTKQNDQFKIENIPGIMQRIALSNAPDGIGLVPLNPDKEKMDPFEGSGVSCWWLLEVPPGGNKFNFDTIADIQFIIEYSSYEDETYGETVRNRLSQMQLHNTRAFRLRFDFPDSLYHLMNPSLSGPLYTTSMNMNFHTAVINTFLKDYSFNEDDRKLDGITLVFVDKDGQRMPVDKLYIASHNHLELLWNALRPGRYDNNSAEADYLEIDDFRIPIKDDPRTIHSNEIRVLRDSELLRIANNAIQDGDVFLEGDDANKIWKRILREKKLTWVREDQILPKDVLIVDPNRSPEIIPLPEIIPADLIRKLSIAVPETGAGTHILSFRTRDDGTPSELSTGESEIESGEWVRTLVGTTINWKKYDNLTTNEADSLYGLADRWYITLDSTENQDIARSSSIAGYEILDLGSTADVLMLMNYSYKLP